MSIFHRRNGIALTVILAMALTVVILVILKPNTDVQYIVYSVIICSLFLVPSAMYYMLIVNYKKTIATDIIPKIIISLTNTLQSMLSSGTYTPKQQAIIGQVASETVITSVMRKNPDTADDVPIVIARVNDSEPLSKVEKNLSDVYGIEAAPSLIPEHIAEHAAADQEMKELIDKTKIVSQQQVGATERQSRGIDFAQIQNLALARQARMGDIDIETQIPKHVPVDDSSAFKRELQSVTYTFNQKKQAAE